MAPPPTAEEIAQAHKTLYEVGYALRTEVAGEEHVQRSLRTHSSAFSKPMQEMATEAGWGWVWGRPGLEKKQRSLINIAMLCTLNRMTELRVHVRGAVRNGVSEVEIREVLIQVGGYVGIPAALEGTRVAESVLNEMAEKEGYKRELP